MAGGGHATSRGMSFQHQVAAWTAVHALAEQPISELFSEAGQAPKSVWLETTSPIDDVMVETDSGGYFFINVKTSVSLSGAEESDLAAVIEQFVRQWLVCSVGTGKKEWDRPLHDSKDRFVLAVSANNTRTLLSALNPILERIRHANSITPADVIATTKDERNAYDIVMSHMRRLWKANAGVEANDDQIVALLKLVKVIKLDFDGASKTSALSLLKASVLGSDQGAPIAWDVLQSLCTAFGSLRGGGGRATFREELRSKGIALKDSPTYARDIARIKEVTQRTLSTLARYAHLTVPTSSGKAEVEVARACSSSIADAAATLQSFLVVGEPGAGKSGALHAAVKILQHAGHPVVLLAVDEWTASSLENLRVELGLDHPLLDVLNAWMTTKHGVLIIDALDASRGNPSDRAFQDLIDAALRGAIGWAVIASIRKFDLRYGVTYQELFRGEPVAPNFIDNEFPRIRHLHVPRLTKEELDQVWDASALIKDVYENGSVAFRKLLTSPFNLFLLSTIVSHEEPGIGAISTQVGLLGKYWLHRVDQPADMQRVNRIRLLKAMVETMVERRQLSVKETDLTEHNGVHFETLLKNGVLVSQGDAINRISFSHHMLFDYAVSRLVMLEFDSKGIEERLTLSDDHALILAPAVMLALRMLWERDSTRKEFWQTALAVASSSSGGPFSRMLPARVAADVVATSSDFDLLVSILKEPKSEGYGGSLFLVKHIFGTLLANVVSRRPAIGDDSDPWCHIVRRLSEVAIADLVWPFKAVIAQWVEKPEDLTRAQKADLGVSARLLLMNAAGKQENYDDGSVSSGIRGVARTYETAPSESASALRLILEPAHVAVYGHRELFWFAVEFNRLLVAGPEILGDLFRTVYRTPLPSSDEVSYMGNSRILTLTSNKRQDFEMARHQLEDKTVPFLLGAPAVASSAIIDALDYLVLSEHSASDDEPTHTFPFHEFEARIKDDYSYIWWRPNDKYSLGGDKILDGMVEALGQLCVGERHADIDSIVNTIAGENTWACTWAALLQAGIKNPIALKRHLLPLISSPVVLGASSTHYAAGQVIERLHLEISDAERYGIERAILGVEEPSIQSKLLSCLQPDRMVDLEAIEARKRFELSNSLRKNSAPYSLEMGRGEVDGNWWYREAGIDLTLEPNLSINAAIKSVEELVPPEAGEKAVEYMRKGWPSVLELYALLQKHPAAPERLRLKGWDELAEVVEKAARVCGSADDLANFKDIQEILFGALSDEFPPEPKHDQEREISFAKSAAWGRPAPRIEAAGALMLLARAMNAPSEALGEKIRKLAVDPAVEVRHTILSRVNTLFSADPELMREISDRAFAEEKNIGVLTYFLGAIYRTMRLDSAKVAAQILDLDDRLSDGASDDTKEIYREIAGSIVSLWVTHSQEAARVRITTWLRDPVRHRSQVQRVLTCLRDALLIGDPANDESKDHIVRKRAVAIFTEAVFEASKKFNELSRQENRSSESQEAFESALRVLDTAASELYFGSGVYERGNSLGNSEGGLGSDPSVRLRFLSEMDPVLDDLTGIGYPSVTHHLLQTLEGFITDEPEVVLRMILKTLHQGGQHGGYQFESLGADLFVRLVRRYLADYSAMIANDPDFRTGIVKALDLFAQVGWADARQLVYELPEMLR